MSHDERKRLRVVVLVRRDVEKYEDRRQRDVRANRIVCGNGDRSFVLSLPHNATEILIFVRRGHQSDNVRTVGAGSTGGLNITRRIPIGARLRASFPD